MDAQQIKAAHEQPRNFDWLSLQDQVVVVTGASGGIGAEVCRAFSQAGCAVALLDTQPDALASVAAELTAHGGRAVAIRCDVANEAAVSQAGEQVAQELGPCRILVNTAAVLGPGDLLDIPLGDWNRMLSVNLTGYFLCARVFGEQMRQSRRGAMVHVSSVSARLPQPHSGAYSITKAGIGMMSQLLAAELGSYGIRSNVVSPGMVRTPMSEQFYQDPEFVKRREGAIPLGRIGRPRDIAEVALLMASDRCSYVSGQEVVVDGGLLSSLATILPRAGYGPKNAAR